MPLQRSPCPLFGNSRTAVGWEQEDPKLASSIKELGWVKDGIEGIEYEVVENLLYIAVLSRTVASSIVSLSWVQDGVDGVEPETIGWLNNIGSAEVASAVVSLGWVADGIDETEVKAIQEISYIDYRDTEVAFSVVSMDWVRDGIDGIEAEALDWINNMKSAEVASAVVSLRWVADGIDETEAKAIQEISYIDYRDADVASSVVSMDWVQDGIDGIEAEALDWMNNMRSGEVASSVVSLVWFADGINEVEVKAIVELSYLANGDAGAALRIVGMPFLETIEPPDISAVMSLSRLATFAPEAFVVVMSHASIRGGISNDLAPVVATLYGVAKSNPRLLDILLDESKVSLEQRTITLPLAGKVVLSIIRTGPGAATTKDLLEHSVRGAEEYMGLRIPTNYVGLLYEDGVYGSNAGVNHGTHIQILPEYDVADGGYEAEFAGSVIAHEVAHYYWGDNQGWVDEGAANFMASVIDGSRTGRPVAVSNPPCGHAGSLAGLESLGISVGDVEYLCNYSLGERLFVDLYRTLGHERFQQGFRNLYVASVVEDDDEIPGTAVGVEHVRDAFSSDDGSGNVVISRWYDGTEPYDLSRLDAGPAAPILPSINGRIEKAYVITSLDGPAVTTFSAQGVSDYVYLALEYAYAVSSGPREVPLEIVEFYEDGLEFSRNSGELTAGSQVHRRDFVVCSGPTASPEVGAGSLLGLRVRGRAKGRPRSVTRLLPRIWPESGRITRKGPARFGRPFLLSFFGGLWTKSPFRRREVRAWPGGSAPAGR